MLPGALAHQGTAAMHGCRCAGDLKTGYLEKRIGEHSGRQSLPEAWRWQKRYFVLTEPKGALYYFKTADDPPNYKGIVNMRECKAEDVEARHLSSLQIYTYTVYVASKVGA